MQLLEKKICEKNQLFILTYISSYSEENFQFTELSYIRAPYETIYMQLQLIPK